jgi:hypothetical protein
MILFLVLAGVQVGLLLLAFRWLFPRMSGAGRMTPEAGRNLLVSVVRALPARGRRALYAAANSGQLRRGTWNGCAVNRAGEVLGMPVRSRAEAAVALATTGDVIGRFLQVWDGLPGSNRNCTAILRDALEQAGLFDDDEDEADADARLPSVVRSLSRCPERVRPPGTRVPTSGPGVTSARGAPRRWPASPRGRCRSGAASPSPPSSGHC